MQKFEKTTRDSYNNTVDDYIKNTTALRPIKELKKLFPLLKRNSLILDLGCGPGLDAEVFIKEGFRVIGVDFSKKMIGSAKKRVKSAEFKVMNIKNLEFKDESFDAIWANAIFLHIPKKDIPSALNEVFRILKKGGAFYVSVKEGHGEILKPDAPYNNVKKFWSFFQKDEIKSELKKANFKILESYIDKKRYQYMTNPWIQIFCKK